MPISMLKLFFIYLFPNTHKTRTMGKTKKSRIPVSKGDRVFSMDINLETEQISTGRSLLIVLFIFFLLIFKGSVLCGENGF